MCYPYWLRKRLCLPLPDRLSVNTRPYFLVLSWLLPLRDGVFCSFSLAFLQVVGNRGTIEINPRDTMAKESSIIGVMLGHATEVT